MHCRNLLTAVGLLSLAVAGRVFGASGYIVVRPMGLPVPRLALGPRKTAAPAGWAACVYNLRTLGPAYLLFTRGSEGCSLTTAPGGRGFLVAWPEVTHGLARKLSDLAKGRTVISQFDPASGRVVLKRRFDWLIGDSPGAGQVSLATGPGGLVWLVRLGAADGRAFTRLSSMSWRTGRILGNFRLPNNSFPFLYAVRGHAVVLYENGAASGGVVIVVGRHGVAKRATLPGTFADFPWHLAGRGSTLDGVTRSGDRFISITVGGGGIRKVWERKIISTPGWRADGFAFLDVGTGVVLARRGNAGRCRLYFVRLANGKVERRVDVDFPACLLSVWGTRIYLVSEGGRIAECTEQGKILRVGLPPRLAMAVVGPTQ